TYRGQLDSGDLPWNEGGNCRQAAAPSGTKQATRTLGRRIFLRRPMRLPLAVAVRLVRQRGMWQYRGLREETPTASRRTFAQLGEMGHPAPWGDGARLIAALRQFP